MTTLLYVLSPSYSGSTLLTFVLGTHPAIATVGELKATSRGNVDDYLCSCGARVVECGFWRRIAAEVGRRGVAFDLREFGTHFRFANRPLADRALAAAFRGGVFETARRVALQCLPGAHREFRSIVERNRALIEVISSAKGAAVFLDSSKDPIRLQYLRDSGYWDTKVVRIVRDGRASSSSYMRIHRAAMSEAAEEWRRSDDECGRVAERLPPGSVLLVRYEAFCTDPDRTLADIYRFANVDATLGTKDFRAVEQHILGHAMRLRANNNGIALDEKWKTKLTTDDLREFDRIAGNLNRRNGYD